MRWGGIVLVGVFGVCAGYLLAAYAGPTSTPETKLPAVSLEVYDGMGAVGDYPVGSLVAVLSGTPFDEEHWLPCDGRAIARDDYPKLSDLIERRFMREDAAGESFALPDFSGMAMAHVDSTGWIYTSLFICHVPRGLLSPNVNERSVVWLIRVRE